jgi:hypothetical protein
MSTEPTKELVIRHRIAVDGDDYVVIENYGDQPEKSWRVPNRILADKIVARRK